MSSRYSIINLNALKENFNTVKQLTGNPLVMPIIKANAYGHGLIECGKFLENLGANYFGVALIEEAIQLRHAGIKIPILVLGSTIKEQISLFFKYDIQIIAPSIEKLELINKLAEEHKTVAKIHLKIDTGLARIGIRAENANKLINRALILKNIEIIGIASHFATSDELNSKLMHEQLDKFLNVCEIFKKLSVEMPIRHMANSGAIMQFKESYLDMVRPGIMLYGIYPSIWMKSLAKLNPVMSLHAKIVYFKVLLKNHGISYGHTFKTSKDTRVITVPIGYGDGYPRALSNKGYALFKGNKYQIIGNICMDQMMIDIGPDGEAYTGEEVTLIGKSGDLEITINDLIELYGGSPYEFLVTMNNRIERKYVYNEIPEFITTSENFNQNKQKLFNLF